MQTLTGGESGIRVDEIEEISTIVQNKYEMNQEIGVNTLRVI